MHPRKRRRRRPETGHRAAVHEVFIPFAETVGHQIRLRQPDALMQVKAQDTLPRQKPCNARGMMTPTEFTLAAAALLLTPGPTNTLMAIGGAERGWRAAQPLMLFELGAYLLVTLPLALAGQIALGALPALKPAITMVAGVWVFWLAVRMWRLPEPGTPAQVTARRIFVTTLLNPKALVFGLVLLPGPGLALKTGLFAGLICGVAALWAALGARLAGRPGTPAGGTAALLRRLAALWLAALSLGLLLSAVPRI